MRPKKRVAVFDENEVALGVRCMVLEVWGYAALPAQTADELVRVLAVERIDAVVAVLPRCEHRSLLGLAHALEARVLTLDVKANDRLCIADISLAVKAAPIEVKEALRILTCHKRGPKKTDGMSEARLRLAEMAKVG